MKGFFLGILVAGLAVAGYLYWQRTQAVPLAPALGPDAGGSSAAKKTKKRTRDLARMQSSDRPSDSEPARLSPADLRVVAQGDDLSTPDVLRLDMDHEQLPELTQDQIDHVFRAQEPAILACISRSRPDPETNVTGRVTVKFRIQRAGTVRGVRVEAPAVLQRGGIFGCIKEVVSRLRFPAAGNSQIATYPFSLS
jgi:hypothetical protein